MKITFLGHATTLVEAGGKTVVIDPFLTHNPSASLKAEEVKADAVLLTHGHGDHISDALQIAKQNDCPIIAMVELANHFQSLGAKTHGLNLGGSYQFEFGRVKLTLAFHSSGIDLEDGSVKYAGEPSGILLTMGGKTFYHAGDTALFGDMKLIGEMHEIDVAALPIGDNFTMGPEDAAVAASWIKAGVTFPIHYNTFPVIQQDPERFVKLLEEKQLRGQVLQPGQSLEV
ncbi:metal-dependent hydrolase [Brevibacillus fulvus]|uniref:UPF0173 metal-dependent hydrolase JOD01_002309 n=1 Tax=Brevibacillus fulvus TaxID=1125967 RepID=A0A938Y1I5_9BACL|nr:metal-dependent hydrolase [Brevibacillus fulvus]MBM7590699.1 L-ascorbate metabolism protein UlaG (beta-lactamase superfamily) [Brevibacillus fulvus]